MPAVSQVAPITPVNATILPEVPATEAPPPVVAPDASEPSDTTPQPAGQAVIEEPVPATDTEPAPLAPEPIPVSLDTPVLPAPLNKPSLPAPLPPSAYEPPAPANTVSNVNTTDTPNTAPDAKSDMVPDSIAPITPPRPLKRGVPMSNWGDPAAVHETPPDNLEAIGAYLFYLPISGHRHDRVLIQGRVYAPGQYIDANRNVKWIKRDGSNYIFELHGRQYITTR